MVDETNYITPHEAALTIVATAMKKSRLKLDILIVNSIIGGLLFSAGGMLGLCAQAENPGLLESNPGIIHLIQGLVFPIGLFFVTIMGSELFNSNVLFFTVGICRGAVNIFDLLTSWCISWVFNLGGSLFMCYVICHLSGVTNEPLYKTGSIEIAEAKCKLTFIQTFIRGIAGNFCVCFSAYLQLLAKPLHVKFFLLLLPTFTLATMGFTHVVSDMFLIPMGMIEGANIPIGTFIWKTLISATLGNIVGGMFFALVIPFYLHLVIVERDRKLLKLPAFNAKDEQPELVMDSRVIRMNEEQENEEYFGRPSLIRRNTRKSFRSPPGVFPVMGMGEPSAKEKIIAGEEDEEDDENGQSSGSTAFNFTRTLSNIITPLSPAHNR